jgi:kumamolisin
VTLALAAGAQISLAADRVTFPGSLNNAATSVSSRTSSALATVTPSALAAEDMQATLGFSVPLRMRGFAELQERLGKAEIISPEEMAAKYYPTPADYKMVAAWLVSQGFAVSPENKYNLSVFASGSVSQIERAFQTRFARVRFAGIQYSSAQIAPSLPATVGAPALGINGLQPHLRPKPHSKSTSGQPQSLINNLPPYTVKEIASAYNAAGLSVNGAGQKIGIVIDTFPASSDLASFWQANAISQSLNNIERVQVVSGILPSPSGEETLDVEWSSGMAAGAKVRVYATTDFGFVHLDQAYQAIINDLPSQPTLHQVSLSYGLGETYEATTQLQTDAQYFASLAAGGVTVFVSSGDGGSTPGLNGWEDNSGPLQVECPANDPSVTSVGGTSLHLTTATGAVSSESAWSFGGGGSSSFFARPSWQTGAGVPAGAFRTVPDVALVADLNTGGYIVFDGLSYAVGGTSWGAPTWAGICAMINQARANIGVPSLGLLGPTIYPLGGTGCFRHITTGNNGPNGVYNAGPAYDLCTGLGVPNVGSLIQAIASGPVVSTLTTIPNPPDFDGDGKQDILWRDATTGQVAIWMMNGPAPKEVVTLGSPPLSWVIINTGDFNGNGKSDILWQVANTSQYGIWFMDGALIAGIQTFTLPPYAGQICCVADFDGDGLADLVSFNRSAGAVYFWKNTGSASFVLQTSYAVSSASGWLPLGATRLNGPNASPAVIWRNAMTGDLAAWFMTSFTLSSAASFGNPGSSVVLRGFGDFSGDGKTDLLLFNTSTNAVSFWKSNGTQQPSPVSLAQVSGGWVPVGAENLDGAGNTEIIWRQTSTGTVGAWQVSGSNFSGYIGSIPVALNWLLQPRGFTPN